MKKAPGSTASNVNIINFVITLGAFVFLTMGCQQINDAVNGNTASNTNTATNSNTTTNTNATTNANSDANQNVAVNSNTNANTSAPQSNSASNTGNQASIDPTAAAADWEKVKGISTEDLPNEITINGVTWVKVDTINVMDKESEDSHGFVIVGARDAYRTRQKLKYPDGIVMEDVGRAHVGGYAQFQVKNLTPGKDLAVVRRIDYIYGDHNLEYFVDGTSAGICDNMGTDRVNRWRNWPYVMAGASIKSSTALIKQVAITPDRDVTMFAYWFYQPK